MDRLLSSELGDKVIPAVIDGISNSRGQDFFDAITRNLSIAIGADYTAISRLSRSHTAARTITMFQGEQRLDNVAYGLEGTPCEQVLVGSTCIYREGICEMFPTDQALVDMGIEGYLGTPLLDSNGQVIGLINALYTTPIEDARRVASIFELFAGRVAAEIEATDKAEALEKLNIELQDKVRELDQHREQLEQRVAQRTRDIEREKQKAEQANAVKGAFLASMSHEIRTPMNGVLGMAGLLEVTELSEQQRLYLESLQASGKTMMAVVNDILDFSKITAGDIELELVDFNLHEWLELITAPFYTLLPDQTALSVVVDPQLGGMFRGDTVRLQQVIGNLLGNAIKFTESGSIELRVEALNRGERSCFLQFSISDTGIGISQEQQERIFSPFVQADASVNRNYGGTGLGLPISRDLVELMGGSMTLRSTPGRGSCFSFSLPLGLGEAPEAPSFEGSNGNIYSNLRVLVVEDNPVNRLLAEGQLRQLGIEEPTLMDDGADAVAAVCQDSQPYDIVLMDCEMPGMDGYEATRQIRQWERSRGQRSIPIYAITAHVLEENSEQCSRAGMDGRLTKPVKIDDYRPVLDSLSSHQARFL